jgi:hypothetical protein
LESPMAQKAAINCGGNGNVKSLDTDITDC